MGQARNKRSFIALMASAAIAVAVPSLASAQSPQQNYNIPAQDLGKALTDLARQSNREIYFSSDLTRGKTSHAVQGQMSTDEALGRLLAGSGLKYSVKDNGAITVSAGGNAVADTDQGSDSAGISEILVVGSRSQNVDIKRTEDGAQPYVVFDSNEIEHSGARNLEEFFRKRLPMNQASSVSASSAQFSSFSSNSINLRGLSQNETLILVDGRRPPRMLPNGQEPTQANVNGIPLSAIERIEVLPSTAGGIYGSGAVGGVINIIRKRNYNGIDARVSYEGSFHGGGEVFRAELSGGFTPNNGSTNISFSAAYNNTAELKLSDNKLWKRGYEAFDERNVDGLFQVGYTTNIESTPTLNIPCIIATGSTAGCQIFPNLVLDNGMALGSWRTFVPIGYMGTGTDGGARLTDNAGAFNLELSNDRIGRKRSIYGAQEGIAFNLNLRQSLTPAIELFTDLTYSSNKSLTSSQPSAGSSITIPASANPFQQSVNVFIPYPDLILDDNKSVAKAESVTVGGIAKLFKDWSTSIEYSWSKSTTSYNVLVNPLSSAFVTAVQNGTIDVFKDLNLSPINYSPYLISDYITDAGPYDDIQQVVSVRTGGSLFNFPGGPLKLTTLAEYRHDSAEGNVFQTPLTPPNYSQTTYPKRSQSAVSLYGELVAPLFSPRNKLPGLHELTISASVRHDLYKTRTAAVLVQSGPLPLPAPPDPVYFTNKPDATVFTISGKWAPTRDLFARVSYATGFRVPSIVETVPIIRPNAQTQFVGFRDPLRGNEIVGTAAPFTYTFGGNVDLEPEKSKSLSAGLVLTPGFLEGLRFSVDYTKIRKDGEISSVDGNFVLLHEGEFSERVRRGAPSGGLPGPVIELTAGNINIARTKLEALDLSAEYEFDLPRFGRFRPYAIATRQYHLIRQTLPTSIPFDSVGTNLGPLKWRGNAGVDWTLGGLSVFWNMQYYGSYSVRIPGSLNSASSNRNVQLQGAEKVPSQSYHDLVVEYDFGDHNGILEGLVLNVGIENLFGKKPPLYVPGAIAPNSASTYSPYGDPRLRRFSMSLSKHL